MCGMYVCVVCMYVWYVCMCGMYVCVVRMYVWYVCMCDWICEKVHYIGSYRFIIRDLPSKISLVRT